MLCPLCESQEHRVYSKSCKKLYLSCSHCGLVFLDKKYRLNKEDEKKRYLSHENSSDDSGYRQFLSKLTDPLSKELQANSYGLDYGCGPGPTLSLILQELGHQIKLYDPFFYPETSVLENQYDFITCTEAAEHFYFPKKELKTLYNMLKPNGILAVMTHILTEDIDFDNWYYPRDKSHVVFYTKESLQYIEEQYNWTLEILSDRVIFFRKYY